MEEKDCKCKSNELQNIEQLTIQYHQEGLNGAQAVLKALMDVQVIPHVPELVQMTSAWKGGVGGDACSAFAAATLAIQSISERSEVDQANFKEWFLCNYKSMSCPEITAAAGGRPSATQKQFCDILAGSVAKYVNNLTKN